MEKNKKNLLIELVLVFLFFSVMGWIWEKLYLRILSGVWSGRGFLHGCYLPIYGFGGVLASLLRRKFDKNALAVFLSFSVSCALLEYITSWVLELIYGRRWWDYSEYALNLNGRIYFEGILMFGIVGLVAAYTVIPLLCKLLQKLPQKPLVAVEIVCMSVIVCDFVVSIFTNFI